jgi:hypothetical protein
MGALFWDANDDTASDGDEDPDDDDSRDDLNGNDDTESQIVDWVPTAAYYLPAPHQGSTPSWISPSFPLFLLLQQLRC